MTAHNKLMLYAFRALAVTSGLCLVAAIAGLAYSGAYETLDALRTDSIRNNLMGFVVSLTITLLVVGAATAFIFSPNGLKRIILQPTASDVKGLCGMWACVAVLMVALATGYTSLSRDHSLEASLHRSIGVFATLLVATVAYWVTYRFILWGLALERPPIRHSLPKWPIALLAYKLWSVTVLTHSWALDYDRTQQVSVFSAFLGSNIAFLAVHTIPIIFFFVTARAFAVFPPRPLFRLRNRVSPPQPESQP
jgi:hypothetical protein